MNKIFNCTQSFEGSPIYEGIKIRHSEKVHLIDARFSLELETEAYNFGLRRGICIGLASALFGIIAYKGIKKIFSIED